MCITNFDYCFLLECVQIPYPHVAWARHFCARFPYRRSHQCCTEEFCAGVASLLPGLRWQQHGYFIFRSYVLFYVSPVGSLTSLICFNVNCDGCNWVDSTWTSPTPPRRVQWGGCEISADDSYIYDWIGRPLIMFGRFHAKRRLDKRIT